MCSTHGWCLPRHLLLLPHEWGLSRRRTHVYDPATVYTLYIHIYINKKHKKRWCLNVCIPGRQAGARKAFFGLRAWSFQKLFMSCVMKLQLSPSTRFCPSSVISGLRQDKGESLLLGTFGSISLLTTHYHLSNSCSTPCLQSHGVMTLFRWNAPSCWVSWLQWSGQW